MRSVLDDIPGVGPARRKALMRHFKSIDDIRNAEVSQLSEVDEIPVNIAEEIYAFFMGKKKNKEEIRQIKARRHRLAFICYWNIFYFS